MHIQYVKAARKSPWRPNVAPRDAVGRDEIDEKQIGRAKQKPPVAVRYRGFSIALHWLRVSAKALTLTVKEA
jgi:hypothetical protein